MCRVKFIIADRIADEVKIGTAFLKRDVIAILCTLQRIRIRNDEIKIVKKLTRRTQDEVAPFDVKKWTY